MINRVLKIPIAIMCLTCIWGCKDQKEAPNSNNRKITNAVTEAGQIYTCVVAREYPNIDPSYILTEEETMAIKKAVLYWYNTPRKLGA